MSVPVSTLSLIRTPQERCPYVLYYPLCVKPQIIEPIGTKTLPFAREGFKSAAEEASALAAEQLGKIAKAHIGAGIAAHSKAPEVSGAFAVACAAVFDGIEGIEVFGIVRLHAHRPPDMLQCRYLIAQTVIGQGAEVIPPGVALGGITSAPWPMTVWAIR